MDESSELMPEEQKNQENKSSFTRYFTEQERANKRDEVARMTEGKNPEEIIDIILQLEEQKAMLQARGERDDLTGALNRKGLARELEEERIRALRLNSPITLMMGDFDNFKGVNDTYGHAAGDAVLQATHYALATSLRAADRIGRWSGDEIAGFLVDANENDIPEINSRLKEEVVKKVPDALRQLLPDDLTDKTDEIASKVGFTMAYLTVDPNELEKVNTANLEHIYTPVDVELYELKVKRKGGTGDQ